MNKGALRIRVTERDINWSRFLRIADEFKGRRTEVGLPEKGSFTHNGESKVTTYKKLMEVALYNEYGSSKTNLPERALFRKTHEQNERYITRIMNAGARDIALGRRSVDSVLFDVGEEMVQKIRDNIIKGMPPRNAYSTIIKKGFDHPLLMTGQLYDNIQHREYRTNAGR